MSRQGRTRFLCFALCVGCLLGTPGNLFAGAKTRTVRTFHIGNSLTDTIDGWLAPAAGSAGRSLDFHRFTIPGAPTDWLWDHPGSGFGDSRYEQAFSALAPIDHLFTQPFAGHGRDVANEAEYSGRFYRLARRHSPNVQMWLYVQWPSKTFDDRWSQARGEDLAPRRLSAARTWEQGVANHVAYTELVRARMQRENPGKPIRIVPGGPALARLKRAIEAGRVPGIADFFGTAFSDDVHLGASGRYLIALVHYACVYGESPENRVGPLASGLTPEQARIFGRIAWETARSYAYSGVAPAPPRASAAPRRVAVRQAAVPGYVWWEAEDPVRTNFPPADRHEFAPANPAEAAALSGGRWIGASGRRPETLFLEYDVRVPAEGQWQLYARKFWQHGPFRWRFDDRPWQQVGRNVALLDNESLRQFVGANWVHVGAAKLAAGTRRLRIELTENEGAAAFDAFVLARQPFLPRGKMKPGEKYARAPEGWFAFEPDPDPFTDSPIDLRALNERTAGQNGFIRVKNGQFVHGRTGRPVRFWAVNAGPGVARMDNASIDHLARFLAKRGVNMVRYHGAIYEGSGPNLGRIDSGMVDRVHYFVAAMKRQGIYTTLSIYFPLWVRLDEKQGWPGYQDRIPFAVLFFNPEFQKMYRSWWRALLTPENPYTGTPLAGDPAVAVLEMVNEDSYFFWTFTPYENLPAPQMALMEKQFGDWLAKRYGSVEKALASWRSSSVRGDDAAAGRAGFVPLWEIFSRRDRRAQDTAAFLTESQRRFFAATRDFLKKDLGYRATLHGSNWVTANAQILGPLDKYSNTAADFLDRHGYFGGPHEGERASYSVSAGDRYDDRSALLFTATGRDAKPGQHDFGLPIFDLFYNNLPSTITEINWPLPNRFRADLPLLAAAYGALQGTNGLFFFALSTPGWQNVLDSKFGIQSPAVLGQFPATALLFRKNLVAAAPEVVTVDLNLGDLRALKGAPVLAPQNLDALRAADIPAGRSAAGAGEPALDSRAFLVGRVAMNFTQKPGRIRRSDLSRSIDDRKQTVRSATGQLLWDYGAGGMTVNAPQAQGLTGFLRKAGPCKTKDVTIDARMEYGTVLLVALDGRPLATSGKILLQVMSEEQNYNWSAPGTGLRAIQSTGGPPIVVRKLAGTVSLRRPDAAKLRVTPLDFNGYRKRPIGSARAISLLPDTLYYLIEKPRG